jgi:hypothetical protein
MRPRRSIGIVLLIVAIATAVAGCGGNPEQVSGEELVEKGDGICRDEQARFDEIQAAPLTSAAVGETQAEELLEVTDDAQADLRDLEASEEIRDRYDRYLDARDEVGDLLEDGKDAAERRDGPAYGKAQQEAAAGAPERLRLAKELGFTVCSHATGAP